MPTLRYLLYLRKSTETEDRQKASIPAQEHELLELARRRSLKIMGEPFRETMSAKKPGRPLFEKMLSEIARGRADGIVCWHLDRLARNPLDGGRVMQALGDKVIKEIITPGRNYTNADDKLMMAIEFGMSTKYVDDLARNVARGQRHCLENGGWPGPPKTGYVRDYNKNELVPDPERFWLIQEIFRHKLERMPVGEIVRRCRSEWCFRTRPRGNKGYGGRPISSSQVYAILRDPFYAGVMRYNGETFPGKHQPAVSWRDYEEVQRMLGAGRTNTPKGYRYDFTYRGYITCGACGALVTAEYTTNRYGKKYLYYHCCRKNKRWGYCPERSVEESFIEGRVRCFLQSLVLPEDLWEAVRAALPDTGVELERTRAETTARLRQQIDARTAQLQRLRTMCADGVISPEELTVDRERILGEQRSLEEEMERVTQQRGLIEPLERAFSFANEAVSSFERGDSAQKRSILREVSSNRVLKGKELLIKAKRPFDLFMNLRQIPVLSTRREELRTLVLNTITKNNTIDELGRQVGGVASEGLARQNPPNGHTMGDDHPRQATQEHQIRERSESPPDWRLQAGGESLEIASLH